MTRRLGHWLAAALVALAAAGVVLAREDDRPVDPRSPTARAAAATALEVVPGRVLGVATDRDDGNWEVTIAQGAREYEVELAPGGLDLLRLDYD